MRDWKLVHDIAARGSAQARDADLVMRLKDIDRAILMREASVGPHKPMGSVIKPTNTRDWGLRRLRDLSWEARRTGGHLNTGRPRLP